MATGLTRWRPFTELEDLAYHIERMFSEMENGETRKRRIRSMYPNRCLPPLPTPSWAPRRRALPHGRKPRPERIRSRRGSSKPPLTRRLIAPYLLSPPRGIRRLAERPIVWISRARTPFEPKPARLGPSRHLDDVSPRHTEFPRTARSAAVFSRSHRREVAIVQPRSRAWTRHPKAGHPVRLLLWASRGCARGRDRRPCRSRVRLRAAIPSFAPGRRPSPLR